MKRVHHVQITIPAGAEDAGRAFYCGILGLEEIPKPQTMQGRGGFWLTLGDLAVHVGVEDTDARNHTKAHLAYEVSDLDLWRQRITAQGIKITAPPDIPVYPGYSRFQFRDPFGNRVEFLQSLNE